MKAPRTIFLSQKQTNCKYATENLKLLQTTTTLAPSFIKEKNEIINETNFQSLKNICKKNNFKIEIIKFNKIKNDKNSNSDISKLKTNFDDNIKKLLNTIKTEDDDFVDVES